MARVFATLSSRASKLAMTKVRGRKSVPGVVYQESETIHEHVRELEAAYDLLFEEVVRRRELSTVSINDNLV